MLSWWIYRPVGAVGRRALSKERDGGSCSLPSLSTLGRCCETLPFKDQPSPGQKQGTGLVGLIQHPCIKASSSVQAPSHLYEGAPHIDLDPLETQRLGARARIVDDLVDDRPPLKAAARGRVRPGMAVCRRPWPGGAVRCGAQAAGAVRYSPQAGVPCVPPRAQRLCRRRACARAATGAAVRLLPVRRLGAWAGRRRAVEPKRVCSRRRGAHGGGSFTHRAAAVRVAAAGRSLGCALRRGAAAALALQTVAGALQAARAGSCVDLSHRRLQRLLASLHVRALRVECERGGAHLLVLARIRT
jgi:hypothetical protein